MVYVLFAVLILAAFGGYRLGEKTGPVDAGAGVLALYFGVLVGAFGLLFMLGSMEIGLAAGSIAAFFICLACGWAQAYETLHGSR